MDDERPIWSIFVYWISGNIQRKGSIMQNSHVSILFSCTHVVGHYHASTWNMCIFLCYLTATLITYFLVKMLCPYILLPKAVSSHLVCHGFLSMILRLAMRYNSKRASKWVLCGPYRQGRSWMTSESCSFSCLIWWYHIITFCVLTMVSYGAWGYMKDFKQVMEQIGSILENYLGEEKFKRMEII